MPRVLFTPHLRRHLACPTVDVPGRTVREVLAGLFIENTALRGYVLDDQDRLRQHVVIFIDGPNNRKLAALIPDVYACPGDADEAKPSTTSYLAVLGPSTMWPGSEVRSLLVADGQIKDGASRTVMVVEVADSGIHWMEPRDLHVLQMAPTINPQQGQGISSPHESGANVLFGDGSVRFLTNDMPAETLRQLLLIDDGVPDEDW